MWRLPAATVLAFVLATLVLVPRAVTAQDGGTPEAPALVPRAVVGAIASDGAYPELSVSTSSVFQGGALLLAVSEGASGMVTFLGRTSPLSTDGPTLTGFVGVGTEDPPGPATLSVDLVSATGEPFRLEQTVTVVKTEWTVDYIVLPPGEGSLLDPALIQAEADRIAAIYAGRTPRKWSSTWLSPLDAPISGYFGEQRSFNGGPVGGHHGGTDFAAAEGTPVAATNAGTVVLAEELAVRGNMVIIDHGGGVFSGYAHLSALHVTAGQTVTGGDVIGLVGTTGLSTGPHLHWEMAVAGVLVDGLRWLDGTQGY